MAKPFQARNIRKLLRTDFARSMARNDGHESWGSWKKRVETSCAQCLHRKNEHVAIFGCIEIENEIASCTCQKYVPPRKLKS